MVALPAYNTHSNLQTGGGNYTVSNLLAANIAEVITVPTDDDGKKARFVTFGKGAAADFYAGVFSASEGADRITNGTFAAYQTNGTFATDTGWTKGTGWTIAAGVATATGAISTALSQTSAITLIPGFTYTLTFTVSGFAAGTVTASVGGTAGTARGSDATFIETFVAGASQIIAFTGAGFTGNIDNVSVTAWGLGTGWTTDGSTAIASGAINTNLTQIVNSATPLVAGQAYLVTYTATASAGSFVVDVGGGTAGAARSTSATFSEVLIAGATQTITFDGTGFTGTIDTVSVMPAISTPIDASTGLSGIQNPIGFDLGINAGTVAIVSAGTPVITTSFFK